jgi:hypothetical protein
VVNWAVIPPQNSFSSHPHLLANYWGQSPNYRQANRVARLDFE